MASIAKRPNGKWLARYRDDAKKEHTRTFDTKRDGMRWLNEVTTSRLIGQYVDPRNAKMPLRVYVERWQSLRGARLGTAKAVDSVIRVHLLPALGDREIGSIRHSDMQALANAMRKTLKGSTVKVRFGTIAAIFNAAVRERVIAVSPCEGVKIASDPRTQIEPLSTETVLRIADEIPARWRALVMLSAGTGLRPGEAAGLAEDRLAFPFKTIRVDQQLLMYPTRLGPLKTDASYRTIPMPQIVHDELKAHLDSYATGPGGLLFTAEGGEELNRDVLMHRFAAACKKVNAPAGTTLHSLRHYYASLLIRHGESVKVVQSNLGHATAKETLDTYAHLWPDSHEKTRSAIDSSLGATSADYLRTEEG